MSKYAQYRGKCKELSEELVNNNPELTLVRGFYHCPMWGKQPHWWTKDKQGKIIDPSVEQFPTAGYAAEYEEFNGNVECSNCGIVGIEADFKHEGNYSFCSGKCYGQFVGLI